MSSNRLVEWFKDRTRRFGLATCCIVAPILIAVGAFHLVIDHLVPAKTDELTLEYRFLSEAESAPQVPAPLLRAPLGTLVRLTVRNRSDSALVVGGLRRLINAAD